MAWTITIAIGTRFSVTSFHCGFACLLYELYVFPWVIVYGVEFTGWLSWYIGVCMTGMVSITYMVGDANGNGMLLAMYDIRTSEGRHTW